MDDTTKAVDLVVQYYDQEFKPLILLALECKRQNKKKRGIKEMEEQLHDYIQSFFEPDGLAQGRRTVFGAVAYGAKIRAWKAEFDGRYTTLHHAWGNSVTADEGSYKDPGEPHDAEEIFTFFQLVKKIAITPAQVAGGQPSYQTPTQMRAGQPIYQTPTQMRVGQPSYQTPTQMRVGQPSYQTPTQMTGGQPSYQISAQMTGGASMGVGGSYGGASGGMGGASGGASGRYEDDSRNMGEDSGSYGDVSPVVEGVGGGIGSDIPSGSSDSTSIIMVDVTKKKRGMNPTEYSFTDAKGTKVSTTASQWKARNGQFTHKRNNQIYMSKKPLA
ncbi:hypothetical protein HYALB_00000670 [Hymenoscyphus albidus]|uniref:Uncharacterized protein n=1 Tax=Hymenoscyphus albidus TaxID=595503 RepID=A0A9N9Q8M1_9HELO|nr:hypothetical protein HYALB_00000670 [Hymenoscyphus albidus]